MIHRQKGPNERAEAIDVEFVELGRIIRERKRVTLFLIHQSFFHTSEVTTNMYVQYRSWQRDAPGTVYSTYLTTTSTGPAR